MPTIRHQCAECARYRARIHQLAGDLDKLRREWEEEQYVRNWHQELANTALRRIYGETVHTSWEDRQLIGLGLRALADVGIDGLGWKLSRSGWGNSRIGRMRHWLVMTLVIRPLRWLVGIPRR